MRWARRLASWSMRWFSSCWMRSLRGIASKASFGLSPADSMLSVPEPSMRSRRVWLKLTSVIFDRVMSLPFLLRIPLRTMTRCVVMT